MNTMTTGRFNSGKSGVFRVLVGCESSGIVREAFRSRGHDAWSCDLLPADDDSPHHYQSDVMTIIPQGWDIGIFHPPCTYLNSAGLHWNTRRPGRAAETEKALEFVRALLESRIARIALENPIGCISTRIRKPDQIIQPFQFGEDASKQTCLWLKNLPPLKPTAYCKPRMVCACGNVFPYEDEFKFGCPACGVGVAKPRWSNQTDSGQNKLAPSPDRWKIRAATYPGIAAAMAEQWGTLHPLPVLI